MDGAMLGWVIALIEFGAIVVLFLKLMATSDDLEFQKIRASWMAERYAEEQMKTRKLQRESRD